jgi:energy-coupling factor transporter ATP-binding protein EcfA2
MPAVVQEQALLLRRRPRKGDAMSIAEMDHLTPAVVARGMSTSGRWGNLFGPVDLDIAAGGVTVLVGPTGLGATALLLTLAGRMAPLSGTLTVLGRAGVPQIFSLAAAAGLGDVDAVDEFITVGDAVTEQIRWREHWYRRVPQARDGDVQAVCRPVFGNVPVPSRSTFVGELCDLDALLLRIALANVRRRPVLVVGSLDQLPRRESRDVLLHRLAVLGRGQTVVTAAADEVNTEYVRAQVRLDHTAPARDGQEGAP